MFKPAVYVCSGCSGLIYEGDSVWHIMGEQFCQECIDKAREEAVLHDAD